MSRVLPAFVTRSSPSATVATVVPPPSTQNRSRFALLLAGALVCTGRAHANGAFPAVSQLLSDPADPAHLVLRSNFGLLTTRDRGSTWDLVCEAGVGYQNVEPPIALLDDGTTIAALPNGIAHGSTDECSFGVAPEVASYVADVSRVPGAEHTAVAISTDFDSNVSQIWRTTDGGSTWSAWGVPITDLNAATLDVASPDSALLYVSGIALEGGVSGAFLRSIDGGETWQRFDVPGASKVSAPYIAGLAKGEPDTVYVRLSGTPGHLLVTHDGGQHFSNVLDFEGPFDGFALSPDGRTALASGRSDGVWRAPTDTLAFERLSCAQVRCLSWSDAGLFACADEGQAGFLVGESTDSGSSFTSRLHLPCVRGPLACPAQSSVGTACSAAWPAISEQLGTDCASADSFVPSTDCDASSAAAAGEGASGGASGAPVDNAGGSPSAGHAESRPSNGSSCSLGEGAGRGVGRSGLAIVALAACWARRRRARG